jgi:pimeloyl-ACP methyl ester carboxylesterase
VYGYEVARLTHEGYIVAAPDYEGLGTPGAHTYLQTDPQAFAVIDAVRAARQVATEVAGTSASTRWAVVGHSQGGQAAIGAAELAEERAPELELVGAVALAPAMMMNRWIESMAYDEETWPYEGYMAVGIGATHPGFAYADFVGPTLRPYMAYAEEMCWDQWFPMLWTYLQPGKGVLAKNWSESPAVQEYLDDSQIGLRQADAPVIIMQGTADGLYAVLDAQVKRMCKNGSTVAYRTYKGVEHDPVVRASWPATQKWLAARFADEPAKSVCA